MNDYDFSRLNDKEFEVLCTDFIGAREKITFERFKAGPDEGVDGRHFTSTKAEWILQAKHWVALALIVLIISMHAIPSTADIALGLKGFAIIAIAFGGSIFLLQMIPFQGEGIAMAFIITVADFTAHYLEIGMWHALYGAITVVILSVAASVVLILPPAFIYRLKLFWDGARGHI